MAVLVRLPVLLAVVIIVQALLQRRPHLVARVADFDLDAAPEELVRTAASLMALLQARD